MSLHAAQVLGADGCPALSDAEAEEYGAKDFAGLMWQMNKHSRGFAVPPWAMPKAIWQIILKGSSGPFQELLHRLCVLIRKVGRAPLLWSLSLGAPVPKHNGKPGTLGFRLLHLLDPVSKCWAGGIWRASPFELGPTSFEAVADHQREEATAIA